MGKNPKAAFIILNNKELIIDKRLKSKLLPSKGAGQRKRHQRTDRGGGGLFENTGTL